MKLSVATGCILRCKYCFVDKNNQMMNFGVAVKAVDFFLKSKGKDKILKIYGGEPLLNFDLIEKIVPYAKKKAKGLKKKLTLSLCTNTILINRQHLDFFKKNKFQLAISFDGNKKTHDKYRLFPDKKRTFSLVKKNCKLALDIIDKKNLAVNMSIVPSESGNIADNFKYILNMGFNTLNLEPVYGFKKWTLDDFSNFKKAILTISEMIFSEIPKRNFIFLTTVDRELKYQTLSKLKDGVCLFHQFPEIYPDGSLSFSSFFLNLPDNKREKYIIGNVLAGKIKKEYKNCVFMKGSRKCRECLSDYFNIPDESMSSKIVELRNLVSIDLARKIIHKAKTDFTFKDYIKEAKKHICF